MANNKDQSRIGDGASNDRNYRGDGAGAVGITSDKQPDLVAPNGVDDEEMSDRNGPSDRDNTEGGGTKRPS